jgi:ClpP class serine protease
VAGCFEAVEKMRSIARSKPVRAFAHESAYSAAYAISTVADKRVVSRTGGVGSIGAVTTHVDYSKSLEQAGIKITLIAETEGKTDGNPYEPLPAKVEARIRARITETYDLFVSTVAKNVGLDEKKVRDLKSYTYSAKEAVSNGLADEIGAFDDAVAAFVAELDPEQGDPKMTTKDTPAVDQAALDEGKAEGAAEGKTAGLKEGATAERTRISAIIASDEGKKRPVAAMSIAMDTDMTVEQAGVFLAKLTVETVKKGFSEKMEEGGNPDLGAGEGDDEEKDEVRAAIDSFAVPGFKRRAAK